MIKPQVFEGTEPTKDKVELMQNHRHLKPFGGIWTCDLKDGPFYSDWVEWCLGEHFRGPKFNLWKLVPYIDAKVLVVDTVDKLSNLPEKELIKYYPFSNIDYEAISQDYDGLCLTYGLIRGVRYSLSHKYSIIASAWDVESTVWFRWSFEDVVNLGEFDLGEFDFGE